MVKLILQISLVLLPFLGFTQNFNSSRFDTLISAYHEYYKKGESVNIYWTIADNRWGMIDTSGNTLLPNVYNYPIFQIENQWQWESDGNCYFSFERPVLLKRDNNYDLIHPLTNENMFPILSQLISVGHDLVADWHYLIKLADGSFTYLDIWGAPAYKAKTETPPFCKQTNRVLIVQNGELVITDEKGNIIIPSDSLNKDILIDYLDTYYQDGSIFENRDSSLTLQELINLNTIRGNKLESAFAPIDLKWAEKAILSILLRFEVNEFSYYYCQNDICIREIIEKFQTDGDDYDCWPPLYGTFLNYYNYARKLSDNIYEINVDEETYGHGSGMRSDYIYYKRIGNDLLMLDRSDFFKESENINARFTELAREYYDDTVGDFNLDRDSILIDDNTAIRFNKNGFEFILPIYDWNFHGSGGLIPYKSCKDIIPKHGLIEELKSSQYLKEL
jgi:hypothetical protein